MVRRRCGSLRMSRTACQSSLLTRGAQPVVKGQVSACKARPEGVEPSTKCLEGASERAAGVKACSIPRCSLPSQSESVSAQGSPLLSPTAVSFTPSAWEVPRELRRDAIGRTCSVRR